MELAFQFFNSYKGLMDQAANASFYEVWKNEL